MFLPTSKKEMDKMGWDACDVIIVTPDAYVDHPSFAMAILGRFLEKNGYKVGILSQPKWKEPKNFLELGIPRIAFAVSGGQMDSMVLNYTATNIPRKEDLFCENKNPFFSQKGDLKKYRIRPDRCINVYCSQIRSVSKNVPIIIGGIEASLRRIAHYDYWTNKIRRSVLFDSKADILIYGMGEYPLLRTIEKLESGITIDELDVESTGIIIKNIDGFSDVVTLPSFEEVKSQKSEFAKAQNLFEKNGDNKYLAQMQDSRYYFQNPRMNITQKELDFIYDTDFERCPHPRFENVPAFEMIKTSVNSHRGCYGDCSFCAIASHQGKSVISRSRESVIKEIRKIASQPDFKGTISDIGGPSANMYASSCSVGGCTEHNCLKDGYGCKNLISGTDEYLSLLIDAGNIGRVKHVFINSGIRFDPAILDETFLCEILKNNISGQMKVAPESGSDKVLGYMNKPSKEVFEKFLKTFNKIKKEEGIRKFVIPYIITGHPGEDDIEAEKTKNFLDKNNLRGKQFQVFTPTPMTRSTAMYYLGYDPKSGEPVHSEKNQKRLNSRKMAMIDK
ncbi:YgiQ family radical SAM protein [Methanoplanus sp. FWC-SCC4]|uniref:YgiQ family radical SAM protein n=1 Tax=Methanochimaera problematica TaxID=2609417 RepID=A0AA97FCX8_9EURY|nr:YgiQ family radical SAM protein [Methanoplanus sp. FWC-SCC4]WOF16232.1 YgiQ family radical SAM protein [Methanoplanus sp. FWC-SCC4]